MQMKYSITSVTVHQFMNKSRLILLSARDHGIMIIQVTCDLSLMRSRWTRIPQSDCNHYRCDALLLKATKCSSIMRTTGIFINPSFVVSIVTACIIISQFTAQLSSKISRSLYYSFYPSMLTCSWWSATLSLSKLLYLFIINMLEAIGFLII